MRMAREAGVQLLLQTQAVETIREGDRIGGIVVENKSGRLRIEADVTIDCSGDGDVAARGGCAWEKGRTADGLVQAPTLVFKLGGVDRAAFIAGCKDPEVNYREWLAPFPELRAKMVKRLDRMNVIICGGYAKLVERARQAGEFNVPQSRVVGVKLHKPDEFLVVMTRVLGLDPTSVRSMTDAYALVYEQIPVLVKFFKKWIPGFAQSSLREIAPMLGVRESRRIMGDYVLQAEDLVEGRVFDDAVSMGGYHIDIHRPNGTWVDSHNVRAYTIPIRSLIAREVLFFAEADVEEHQQQTAGQPAGDQDDGQDFARHAADHSGAHAARDHQHGGSPEHHDARALRHLSTVHARRRSGPHGRRTRRASDAAPGATRPARAPRRICRPCRTRCVRGSPAVPTGRTTHRSRAARATGTGRRGSC